MNIDEICKYINKTNDIKVINKILKKLNNYDIPYYYANKLKNILESKSNNLIQKEPNLYAELLYFLTLLILFTINSSNLIVILLEIVLSYMIRKLSTISFPKIFTNDVGVSYINLEEYEILLQGLKETLKFKENNNYVDYMLTKETSNIVNEKIFGNKSNNVNEKDVAYNEQLVNELNKCLEYEGINAFNYFLKIVNNVKKNNSIVIQNYAFELLPKYFLLLCEKNQNINLMSILKLFDSYFITILFKYLCIKEDYMPYNEEFLLNDQKEFRSLTETLLEIHLEDYERSRKKDV